MITYLCVLKWHHVVELDRYATTFGRRPNSFNRLGVLSFASRKRQGIVTDLGDELIAGKATSQLEMKAHSILILFFG